LARTWAFQRLQVLHKIVPNSNSAGSPTIVHCFLADCFGLLDVSKLLVFVAFFYNASISAFAGPVYRYF
jgi:hypothetical protein